MDIIKIKSVTKKQAKAYMLIAYRILKHSKNEISEQSMWDEMEAVMSLYTPKQAVNIAKDKVKDTYRVNGERIKRTNSSYNI